MTSTFVRDRFTWQMYLLLGYYGYLINIFGPLTPFLQADLNISYAGASFHYSAFAVGMILAGGMGDRLTRRLGAPRSIWLGGAAMSLGAILFALGQVPAVTIAASFWMGLTGSQILNLVPGLLSARYGLQAAVALTEMNVVAGLVGIVGPAVVGVLADTSLGWRAALLPPVFFFAALYLVFAGRRTAAAQQQAWQGEESGRLPLVYWLYWAQIVSVVAVEFCMIFWGAAFLERVAGLPRAEAAVSTSLFLAGMILGRTAGSILLRRWSLRSVFLGALGLCALGFGLFWSAAAPLVALLGFALAGLGTANLYPVSLSLAIAAAGPAARQASTRATLASGTAVIALPLLLGGLADAYGLRAAYMLVPVLVFAALGLFFVTTHRLKTETAVRQPG